MRIAVSSKRIKGGAADGFVDFYSVRFAAPMVWQAVSKIGPAGYQPEDKLRVGR